MGRGSSKASRKGNGGGSTSNSSGSGGKSLHDSIMDTISGLRTKYSASEINLMDRKMLEMVVTAITTKRTIESMGISAEEAFHRASLLTPAQSTAQLKKYIKKYG